MIKREIEDIILKRLFKGKAILIFGARQVGKTTLVNDLANKTGEKCLYLNADEADVRSIFSNTTSGRLKSYIGNQKIVILDEAQRIENVGVTLKLITDQIKETQVIATGSSSFELANKTNEPLTGRKYEFFLFPFSFRELVNENGLIQEKRIIEHRLVYGNYPEVVVEPGMEKEHLKLIAGSYLYKDILTLENIKKPVLLEKILRALAFQLGNEVSYHEIGKMVSAKSDTVEKYIDLLEKAYIIFKLPAYSKNVRNEISKGKKIYFYDNGIRNAVIGNYNDIESRTDTGALWENFVISERFKYNIFKNEDIDMFFWRTTQQQEIDLIEESSGKLEAFEIKWNKQRKKFSRTFTDAYPYATTNFITKDNIGNFLL